MYKLLGRLLLAFELVETGGVGVAEGVVGEGGEKRRLGADDAMLELLVDGHGLGRGVVGGDGGHAEDLGLVGDGLQGGRLELLAVVLVGGVVGDGLKAVLLL